MSDEPEYWYCIKHSRVEGRDGCPNKDRMGPYPTEAEAARALETAAERTEAWDHDPRWNDGADGPGVPGVPGDGSGED